MTLTFIGRKGLGGVQMRGMQVARVLGATFHDWKSVPDNQFDTVVLVKYWDQEQIPSLRRACRNLILDPLDCWTQTRPDYRPADFWRWCQQQTQCDSMIATSPAMAESMADAGIQATVIPHHADPTIAPDWYERTGPVVYAGGSRFLGDAFKSIKDACNALGRGFIAREGRDCQNALQGASLTISVRLGDERTPLNVWCKPAVKVANAAAAGIPILCTDDPAITSLCEVPIVTGDWKADIAKALKAPPPNCPHSLTALARRYLELDS